MPIAAASGKLADLLRRLPQPYLDKASALVGQMRELEQNPDAGEASVKNAIDTVGLLNLTGPMTSGAIKPGTLAAIRTPRDIVVDDPYFEPAPFSNSSPVGRATNNITKGLHKTLGTEKDPVIQFVDEFGATPGLFDSFSTKDLANSLRDYGIELPEGLDSSYNTDILENITEDEYDTLTNLVEQLRAIRGTKQVAQTEHGKKYENISDLAFIANSSKDLEGYKNVLSKAVDDELISPEDAQDSIQKVLDNPYYSKRPVDSRLIRPGFSVDFSDHANDILNEQVGNGELSAKNVGRISVPQMLRRMWDYDLNLKRLSEKES